MAGGNKRLRDYFLERKADQETALADALRLGFRLKQVSFDGTDIDVTDAHLAGLKRSIEEYQKAADMLADETGA